MIGCDICGKTFVHLMRHLEKKFPCQPSSNECVPTQVQCDRQCIHCQKILSTYYALKRHIPSCKMKDDDIRQLEDKLKKNVTLDPNGKTCRFCGKEYYNRRNMTRHYSVCKSKEEYKRKLMEEAPREEPNRKKTKTRFSESLKRQIAARQGWRCSACDKLLESTFQVDHTTPLSAGGADDPRNATAMCVGCHAIKTQNEAIERYIQGGYPGRRGVIAQSA